MEREEAARLIETYGPAVYRLAWARTGNRTDAEDVTQETFLRLVRSAPEFRDGEHGCCGWRPTAREISTAPPGGEGNGPWRRRRPCPPRSRRNRTDC